MAQPTVQNRFDSYPEEIFDETEKAKAQFLLCPVYVNVESKGNFFRSS